MLIRKDSELAGICLDGSSRRVAQKWLPLSAPVLAGQGSPRTTTRAHGALLDRAAASAGRGFGNVRAAAQLDWIAPGWLDGRRQIETSSEREERVQGGLMKGMMRREKEQGVEGVFIHRI